MKASELKCIIDSAIKNGAAKALSDSPPEVNEITKAQAFRLYGRSNVERWLKENLITPITRNGKITKELIDKSQLDVIAASSNRNTYLPVADR